MGLNPNGKLPIAVTDDGTIVFDSNAVLLFHSEAAHRGATLPLPMFAASGLGILRG